MFVRSLRFLTAGLILAFATGAHAQDKLPNPWYAAFNGGAAWNSSLTLSGVGTVRPVNPGFTMSAAFGRYVDEIRVFRLEAEVLYNYNRIGNFSGAAASGTISNVGIMFNGIYDFRTDTAWTPYLGGGLGYGIVKLDDFASGATAINDSSGELAYQFKAGVTYQFSPTWVANLGYRLYGTDNLSFTDSVGTSIKSEGALYQSVELGFRFHF